MDHVSLEFGFFCRTGLVSRGGVESERKVVSYSTSNMLRRGANMLFTAVHHPYFRFQVFQTRNKTLSINTSFLLPLLPCL